MKKFINTNILNEVDSKLKILEGSFVDLDFNNFKSIQVRNDDIIGLEGLRKFFLRKNFTFQKI